MNEVFKNTHIFFVIENGKSINTIFNDFLDCKIYKIQQNQQSSELPLHIKRGILNLALPIRFSFNFLFCDEQLFHDNQEFVAETICLISIGTMHLIDTKLSYNTKLYTLDKSRKYISKKMAFDELIGDPNIDSVTYHDVSDYIKSNSASKFRKFNDYAMLPSISLKDKYEIYVYICDKLVYPKIHNITTKYISLFNDTTNYKLFLKFRNTNRELIYHLYLFKPEKIILSLFYTFYIGVIYDICSNLDADVISHMYLEIKNIINGNKKIFVDSFENNSMKPYTIIPTSKHKYLPAAYNWSIKTPAKDLEKILVGDNIVRKLMGSGFLLEENYRSDSEIIEVTEKINDNEFLKFMSNDAGLERKFTSFGNYYQLFEDEKIQQPNLFQSIEYNLLTESTRNKYQKYIDMLNIIPNIRVIEIKKLQNIQQGIIYENAKTQLINKGTPLKEKILFYSTQKTVPRKVILAHNHYAIMECENNKQSKIFKNAIELSRDMTRIDKNAYQSKNNINNQNNVVKMIMICKVFMGNMAYIKSNYDKAILNYDSLCTIITNPDGSCTKIYGITNSKLILPIFFIIYSVG